MACVHVIRYLSLLESQQQLLSCNSPCTGVYQLGRHSASLAEHSPWVHAVSMVHAAANTLACQAPSRAMRSR